ncbi:hypothetical protein GH714_014883 [Hevea brasiliensis]|uniref:non-specific serine/threonine protein kinase n=1 Tax=Hevea brasiliensis TaxID=3981 RepID=A0A6A6KNT9_HEVBR|nr:hypothetical protein GH714_014883 [Hevea brasiliensis]
MGNLVLFDQNNATVWQSFDYPTDSLVPGQKLRAGQKLIASISATNWTQNLLSYSVTDEGAVASTESSPPQVYDEFTISGRKTNREPTYVTLQNGSFALFANSSPPSAPDRSQSIPDASSVQYVRFCPDGHLRLYEWTKDGWKQVADLLSGRVNECFYPTVCGNYGICSNGQCSCPSTTYFKQKNDRQPDLGCSEATSLSCQASLYHSFIELMETTYSSFLSDLENVVWRNARRLVQRIAPAKLLFFDLVLILPMVQNAPSPTTEAIVPQQKRKRRSTIILWSSVGIFSGLFLVIGILVLLVWKKRNAAVDEEDYLDQVPGMPTRFSYENLKALTENFSKVLGEGGFGSVFEGTLIDGTKIAVKRLNGLGQVKKSFLAEVESIGSIHHVNLVRLLGFCADKSHRLLVYEFMSNGSLDKWIFHQIHGFTLAWQQRKKIILDLAKGLTYLHEDCTQKILHLDIKPQNILLDNKFNAKISDFGLSKLIDRDQSKVVTTMRGTPGYLAPEWLSSPEEKMHLISLFEKKAEEDQLLDLVDNCSEDMQLNKAEIGNMMKIAAWCLQKDYTMRPSMSMVVKVLEGVSEVEPNLNYNISNPPFTTTSTEATELSPFLLSGPRGRLDPSFACGFFCNGTCDSYLFAIFIVQTDGAYISSMSMVFPQVVWSANRNNPVRINSTLQLTSDGDFILKDADGTIAWSTNTAGKSVAGLNLTDMGNLVLFDHNNATVWQSFDHPTDSLVPGQKLVAGQKLIPSISATNWTQLNLLSFSVTDERAVASIESSPPQVYYEFKFYGRKKNREPTYVILQNGSFALFANSSKPSQPDVFRSIPKALSVQYIRFCPDGHLRVYELDTDRWKQVADLLSAPNECFYPIVCGNYGICSNGQCRSPSTTYFKQINDMLPNHGFSETTPLSCEASLNHGFIELNDTTYSPLLSDLKNVDLDPSKGEKRENVDLEKCKEACSKNCSCKAAIFKYGSDSARSYCYLPNQIFSLINNDRRGVHYNTTVYLKVQNASNTEARVPQQKRKSRSTIIRSSLGTFSGLFLVIGIIVLLVWKKRNADVDEDDYLDQPEEQMHLIRHFEKKAEENQLSDLVDNCSEDMQLHKAEVVSMMKVAAWCLQKDYAMRPSMSMVVKVLEGKRFYFLLVNWICESRRNFTVHKNGKVDMALAIYKQLKRMGLSLNDFAYATVIKAFCLKGSLEEAADVFKDIEEDGVTGIYFTYIAYIGLRVNQKSDLGYQVLQAWKSANIPFDTYVYAVAIRGFCNEMKLDKAEGVLLDLEKEGGVKISCVVVGSILQCFCEMGMHSEMVDQFNEFKNLGIFLDEVCYNIVVDALCKLRKLEEALALLDEMKVKQMDMDIVHYATLINGYCCQGNLGKVTEAEAFFNSIRDYAAMINGYCKASHTREAYKLFIKLSGQGHMVKKSCCYNLLKNLCEEGDNDGILVLLKKMLALNVEPSKVMYGRIIAALCRVGDEAHDLFYDMKQRGIKPDLVTYTVLLDGHQKAHIRKADNLLDAVCLFDEMIVRGLKPDTVTYTVLLSGFCNRGDVDRAVDLLDQMSLKGIMPDDRTMSVLQCCILKARKVQFKE